MLWARRGHVTDAAKAGQQQQQPEREDPATRVRKSIKVRRRGGQHFKSQHDGVACMGLFALESGVHVCAAYAQPRPHGGMGCSSASPRCLSVNTLSALSLFC